MRNFARALKHAWPYRGRILISAMCALFAAVLWGGNFTSIYPVLKLLNTGESLHQWVDKKLHQLRDECETLDAKVDGFTKREKELLELPLTAEVSKLKRNLNSDLLKAETKLQSARQSVYWYEVFRKYIYAWLPNNCFYSLVWLIGFALVGLIIKCFFEFVQESLVGSVVNRSIFDLRNRFYRKAIHLDVAQFSEQGTTEMMARLTNDMESLGAGMKMLFGKVVAEPLKVISCVTVACMISWQLTLVFLILVPIAALILYRVGRVMRQATRRVLERMSNIYKILQESFQGIRVVKAYTMEAHERLRFRGATQDYCKRSQRVVNIEALADPVIEVLGVTAVAMALIMGSYLVLTHHTHIFGMRMTAAPLEPEAMLQLYVMLGLIADPVRKLSSVFTRLQSGFAASDRIFAFIDRAPHVDANVDGPRVTRPEWLPRDGQPRSMPVKPNFIEFRDVCFSYERGKTILSQINLSVRAGETVALVGPNGCGKTTLITLLPRFYDPDHGSIYLDGMELRHVNLRSLRQQIGLVTQDTFLFDETIANNIGYGTYSATREMIEAAAKQSQAHDFIVGLPNGYETRVGEMGFNKLSGGQKQRLALARAILRDPAILILDEFTSQNDSESKADIHRALKSFKQGRTVFVITHELNTLEIADRIVVLEKGRIVAVGTHVELLASCPTYLRLHEAHNQRLCA